VIAVSIDGELVPPEAASISVLDRGLLYGDGVFEVLRTWDGRAIDLEAHLDRLYTSAGVLELRALPREQLADAVTRTIAAAGGGDRRIRMILTRGPGALTARPSELGPGRAIVIVEPMPPAPSSISLAIVDWPLPRTPGHKRLAYLDHLLARELGRQAGADEALRLDAGGEVAECATANLFAVIGGEILTPPLATGALPGITRAHVLALCPGIGVVARERPLGLAAVRGADELFVTSAVRGIVPVTRLDGEPRIAGPIAARIATAYAQAMRALL
jgi:branched-chain amino acid aminotransferase